MSHYNGYDTIVIGSESNYDTIAQNIFSAFRKANKLHPDLIILEGVDRSGLGISIMNRMIRACGYNVVKA